ncbi:MAG: nucleotidyltransferase domain-containing protein [Candidatus Latescibacterota bacterium]
MAVLDAGVKDKALVAINTLSRFGAVRAAYLFGSQVEGTADEWSDIDVAVFMEGVENWDIQHRTQAMVLVMDEAGNDVEVHLFPLSSLEKPGRGSFAEYILKHGVRIAPEHVDKEH